MWTSGWATTMRSGHIQAGTAILLWQDAYADIQRNRAPGGEKMLDRQMPWWLEVSDKQPAGVGAVG
jgi:hypothetical protein